jgi:flagellar hook-associated protein 3 FlgL
MISRTTTTSLMRSAQLNLQGAAGALAEMRDRATSLQRISKPSDDPIGTANSLLVRAEQRATEQYKRNISDGLGWLTTVDSTLGTATSLIGKVRDLTVQGANDGSMSPTSKEAIAVELESLRADLLTQANTGYLGRSIFAGNSDAGVAFVEDADADGVRDYAFTGAAGSAVERRIDAETKVRVDADGDAIFGSGATSVFALIDSIVEDLRSGTNIGPRLTELDARLETINGHRAAIGTRHAHMMRAEETNLQQTIALETQRSGIEDLDLAKAVLDLQMQEVSYQSALAVTARVLQPTLMDFLR